MIYEIGSRYPEPRDKVRIVQKKDYASGVLIEGVVKDVLTSSRFHPRGHKVRLEDGTIGRVQEFVDEDIKDLGSAPLNIPEEDELV